MSSLRALKRKSLHKQKNNKENNINSLSNSWPNISLKKVYQLQRSKSESDISNLNPSNKKDLKLHAKSERNLQTIYSNFTTSTPCSNSISPSSPTSNITIMQNSSFSVITDVDKIKIPIIGYEVMEERSRFTVSLKKIIIESSKTKKYFSDIQTTH